MSDPTTNTGTTEGKPEAATEQDHTFTQADVDRIVADRLKREREATKTKYADYDELKVRAEGARTAEERVADLERRYAEAETRALRASIANAHGIDPEDRDLFLTGTDEETLTTQATRLAARESERKNNGNHVPPEGTNPQPRTDDVRSFANELFGRALAD